MPQESDRSTEQLSASVEALPGIRRAILEGPPWTLYVVYDPGQVSWGELSGPIARLVGETGVPPEEVEVVPATIPSREPRRRVRLLAVSVRSETRESQGRVVLEWGGREYIGEDTGEASPAGELRLAARATLLALEEVVQGQVSFRLLGVKAMQAFDSEMVVSSVLAGRGAPLVGVALVRDSAAEGAAMAVLQATNRMLGNFTWAS